MDITRSEHESGSPASRDRVSRQIVRMPRVATSRPVGATVLASGRTMAASATPTKPPRIFAMSFASVYPLYVQKAERKGRTKAEVDEVIRWLTGYRQAQLESHLKKKTTFEDFFARAPKLNPSRTLITGVICGVRIEEIKEPLMRELRYLDKLIDELAKGKAMEKILRQ